MTNWRLLEAEIIDIAKREGYAVSQDDLGDHFVESSPIPDMPINLTEFAKQLAPRVELKTTVVKVTT